MPYDAGDGAEERKGADMKGLAATLILATATGALLVGSALAQPGSSESHDAQIAEEAVHCYLAPAEADRTTMTLLADETCETSEAEAQEREQRAGGDDAPSARRVGPLDILP